MNFSNIGISQEISSALQKKDISQPNIIQQLSIPKILNNENIIIKSETGSGKTFAYLLPIFQKTSTEKGAKVIIVAPTKELAMQIHAESVFLRQETGIDLRSCVLFSDVNINKQIEKLKEKPQIIIGTVDRISQLISKKKIPAHLVETYVIDEADRLIFKNNIESLKALIKCFMRDTQGVFVSATFSKSEVLEIGNISRNISLIETAENEVIPEGISHYYLVCESRDKLENLRKLIGILKPNKSLIFINDLEEIYKAVLKLKHHKLNCVEISSETTKNERQIALKSLSDGSLNHLVSTDLASRGLHIDNIDFVFSVTTAENPSDYLHRAGRTGRNNMTGTSICIIAKHEIDFLKKYQARFNIKFTEILMKNGEIYKK